MQGDVQLWFDHLALGSITGYDMFTNLLIDSWSRNTDKILECQSSNDCVVDNQYIDNVLSQLDHSSPDMFQIMSVPAIHKNVTEYFENNVSKPHVETKKDINQIIQDTLLLLPKAVTEQILDLIRGKEPNHHQEASIVEPSISESIKEPLEEELHSHCLIDDNLSQFPTYSNLDSDLDHITAEEENVEISKTSIEEHTCKTDRELKPNLLMFFLI